MGRLADAHVHDDLLQPRHLERVLVLELVHQLRADVLRIEFLQTGRHGVHRSIISPDRRATRTLRPSTVLKPPRVGLFSLGSTWATLETWIDASFSTMPPGWPGRGAVWRFTMLTPCTKSRLSSGTTRMTSPVLPRSRPAMTITLSPFLILSFAITAPLAPG